MSTTWKTKNVNQKRIKRMISLSNFVPGERKVLNKIEEEENQWGKKKFGI